METTKKTRILSLSIIEKAMEAIEENPGDRLELLNVARKYDIMEVFNYYDEVVAELNYQFSIHKLNFKTINDLYITRERLYRVLNPTIYLNAYKEKRANDALYINANVGFIDEKGKVRNVVVFMGKSSETNLERLKEKLTGDVSMIDEAKKKVIEKLLTKITIPEFSHAASSQRRKLRRDVVPQFDLMSEILVKKMKNLTEESNNNESESDSEMQKKSGKEAMQLIKTFIRNLEKLGYKHPEPEG
jgi:hypothetical protein